MAVPDTLDWFATPAAVTTLVTVQVNDAESGVAGGVRRRQVTA